MSTGHEKDTTGKLRGSRDGDWVQAFLELPVEREPGTHFVYNSGASYMLSAIIRQVTGQTLLDYLRPRLLLPLGIQEAEWEACPRGINTGGWGLSLRTEYIACFGQLYLQKGMWQGERLLPEAWVEEATSFQVPNKTGWAADWQQGYGYQFWRCRHGAYRGDGAFGQYCIVLPEQDAVVAITSGTKNMQAVLDLVWTHLLPGLQPAPLSADDASSGQLLRRIETLGYEPLGSEPREESSRRISGKRYLLEANERKLQSVSFTFGDGGCTVTMEEEQGEQQFRCGFGSWAEGTVMLNGKSTPMAGSAAWRDDATLVMEWRMLSGPFSETVTWSFDGEAVNLEIIRPIGGSGEPFVVRGIAESDRMK